MNTSRNFLCGNCHCSKNMLLNKFSIVPAFVHHHQHWINFLLFLLILATPTRHLLLTVSWEYNFLIFRNWNFCFFLCTKKKLFFFLMTFFSLPNHTKKLQQQQRGANVYLLISFFSPTRLWQLRAKWQGDELVVWW